MSNKSREPRLYLLYEDDEGDPRVHWQRYGKSRVPGCSRDRNGDLRPPPCRWIVRAKSTRQACYFVHQGEYAGSTGEVGILWNRDAIHLRSFPEENLTEYWVVLTCYSEAGREASPWFPRADAEEVKDILDERGCRGECYGDHRLVQASSVESGDAHLPDVRIVRPRQDVAEGGRQEDSRAKEPLQGG